MGNYISNGHHPFRRRGTVDGGVVHGLAGILSMSNADGQSGSTAAAAASGQQHQGMSIGFGSVSAVGAMMRRPSNPNTNKISVCRTSRSASRASSAGAGGGGGSKKTTVSSSHDSSSQLDEMTPPPPPLSELDRLKGELRDAKRQIYEREQQLLKLHREIHKLRSVLDHSDAMNALKPSLSMTMLLSAEHNNNNNGKLSYPKKQGVSGESYGSMTSLGDPLQNINFVWKDFDCRRIIQEALQDNSFLKNYLNLEQLDLIVDSMYEKEFSKNTYICRRGTYGSHLYILTYGHCEVIDAHDKPVNQMGPGKAFGELALLYNCTRTASVKTITRVRTWVLDRKVFQMIMMKTCLDKSQTIKQFLKSVPLLRELSDEKISKIGDVVEVDYYPRGDYICRQGSSGDSFYIISKGSCRVTQICHGHFSPDGHGSSGAKSKNGVAPFVKEETIRTLKVGDYFGEQALLLNLNQPNPFLSGLSADNGNGSVVSPTRTANVISEDCECLVLDQSSFFSLLGDLNEIRYKSYNDSEEYNATIATTAAAASAPSSAVKSSANADSSATAAAAAASATSKPLTNLLSTLSLSKKDLLLETNLKTGNQKTAPDPFFYRLTLDDLEHLCQLGQGGFGMVNLVRAKSDPTRVFALKRCSKEFVRASHQEQHIINEKLVMQRVSGRHQFLIQLHRTFRDEKNVYFLMETALGGELWSVLRQRGPFSEQACRFYMGCVIEALQYLHSNNIIYRDLKPENCLLDSDGYLKLTDFGFSKFLQPGDKTWTFCGTPEYVSPEIVLNRGHDKSVDIWSIGILLYELLTGIPPFTSNDPLQTYHIILRGFDSIGFDEGTFSKHCVNLIRALCKENPTERLGVRGRNGYADIKKHKWFAGFNWSHLVARKLAPPIIPSLTSDTDTRYFDTVPLKPDGSRFSPVGPIGAGAGTGGGLTTAPTTTGNKSPSFMLHKSSAKLSSLSSPNTSSSNSSDAGKLNVSKANNESSKESSLQFDYSCDWESYF